MFWGSDIAQITDQWNIMSGIRDQLSIALQEAGIKANLWLPISEGWSCTCKKDDSYDILCSTCYGIGWRGGYRKYGWRYGVCDFERAFYITSDGVEESGSVVYDPNEITVVEKIKPYRLGLVDGVLTGVIQWFGLSTVDIYDLQYDLRGYIRDKDIGNSSIVVEVSINGDPYVGIDTIVGRDFIGVYTVDVRVILSRESDKVRTPLFEILRVRGRDIEKDYILVSRFRSPKDIGLDKYGELDFETTVKLWTLLDFPILSKSVIELLQSPYKGMRYELFDFIRSFWRDSVFRQIFNARNISREREIYRILF